MSKLQIKELLKSCDRKANTPVNGTVQSKTPKNILSVVISKGHKEPFHFNTIFNIQTFTSSVKNGGNLLDVGSYIQFLKSVPLKKWSFRNVESGSKARVYRVQRGLSAGSSELYARVLELSEMSSAEAKWITDEHSLLFNSIWRYWLYGDTRLIILDYMRYSSFLSWCIFIICILPLWFIQWIIDYIRGCVLFAGGSGGLEGSGEELGDDQNLGTLIDNDNINKNDNLYDE